MANEIRELQELIEQAAQAIGRIGLSETRLMNREVREGLTAFMEVSRKVVVALELARQAQAMGPLLDEKPMVKEWVPEVGKGHGPGEPLSTFGAPGYELHTLGPDQLDQASGLIDGPLGTPNDPQEAFGAGHSLEEWTQAMAAGADAQEAEPEAMCPQTKNGVSCARTLHNVGLHTPEGYPEKASWTDKESDD